MTPRGRAVLAVAIAAALLLAWFLLRTGAPSVAPPPARAPAHVAAAPPATTPVPALPTQPPGPARAPGESVPAAPAKDDSATPRIRIHGRIVDEHGAGIAGAHFEVRAWAGNDVTPETTSVSGTAESDGTFDFPMDRDRVSLGFGVETRADGFVEGWTSVKRAEYDEGAGVEVVAKAGRGMIGRVLDDYGRPIPGTTVQLWYGSETTWPTKTGEDGTFRTPRHAPCAAFELIVEAEGFPRRTIPIEASTNDPTDAGDIVFKRGGRVAGVVVDRDGSPVANLTLTLAGIADGAGGSPRAKTDGAGRFEFTNQGEGVVNVYADGGSVEPGADAPSRTWRGGAEDVKVGGPDLRIVVRAETTVFLKFVDPDTRKPVDLRKAQYALRPAGTPDPETLGQSAASSDLFSVMVTVFAGERYDATVRSAGFEDAHVNGIEVPDVAEFPVEVPMRRKP